MAGKLPNPPRHFVIPAQARIHPAVIPAKAGIQWLRQVIPA